MQFSDSKGVLHLLLGDKRAPRGACHMPSTGRSSKGGAVGLESSA